MLTVFFNKGLKVLSNGTGGGCEWYQSIGLIFLNISANILHFLKDPRPLKNKKNDYER